MNNIHFSLIKVEGYRGRNFTIKMNDRGENSVFVMDGNTGKTTAIELLRWCFGFKQSEAAGNFKHMWANPAHIFDDTKTGHQVCTVTVHFSAFDEANKEHHFQFTRVSEGEYDKELPPPSDKVAIIKDSLDIDFGVDAKQNDDVFDYMVEEFRFNDCYEYFCFDGEKARDVMKLASDVKNINILVGLVNRRTTHPKLEEYKQRLYGLRTRVLEEAKLRITNRALERNMTELTNAINDIRLLDKQIEDLKHTKECQTLALNQIHEDYQQIQNQITTKKVKELVELNSLDTERRIVKGQVQQIRDLIYNRSQDWVSADVGDEIVQIKEQVKERGKLPEPYRRDLIDNCLRSKKCEICGRALDKKSEERVKKLELQVAPHEVHDFISSGLEMRASSFDPLSQNEEIKKLITKFDLLGEKIEGISLTQEDQELIAKRNTYEERIRNLTFDIAANETAIGERKEWKKTLEEKKKDLQDKNEALKENKIILDKIDESIRTIDAAEEKIKSKATEIISSVISEGVSSVLGPSFTARFSQTEGLMLGEDGFYGPEKGGYSGRLVLSYCFAEAMTVVGPIIVDTPAGNIGNARRKLASHLVANHNQVILLCLPGEIENFAEVVTRKQPVTITNKTEK